MRQILAPIAGIVVGSLVVAAVEALGHAAYPAPTLDLNDVAAMRAEIARLPIGALWFVLAAWWLGAFGGVAAAVRLAGRRPWLHAGIVGGVMLAAVVANLAMIPHPSWFAVVGVAGVAVATAAAALMLRGRRSR